MDKKFSDLRLRASIVALIIANCVTLIGIVFFNWSVFMVLLLYWLESMIIGIYTILKIILASKKLTENKAVNYFAHFATKLFTIPFFILHYGLFNLVHGAIIASLFYTSVAGSSGGIAIFPTLRNAILPNIGAIKLALICLFISHGVSFFVNYIGKKEYQKYDEGSLFVYPYGRIFVMHLVLIVGGLLVTFLGSTKWLVVVLVLLKIFIDIKSHVKEHTVFKSEIKRKNSLSRFFQ